LFLTKCFNLSRTTTTSLFRGPDVAQKKAEKQIRQSELPTKAPVVRFLRRKMVRSFVFFYKKKPLVQKLVTQVSDKLSQNKNIHRKQVFLLLFFMFEVKMAPPRNRTSNHAVGKKGQEEKPVRPLISKSLKPPQNVCKIKLANGQGFKEKTKKSYQRYLLLFFVV
jgi:hypothetical protein